MALILRDVQWKNSNVCSLAIPNLKSNCVVLFLVKLTLDLIIYLCFQCIFLYTTISIGMSEFYDLLSKANFIELPAGCLRTRESSGRHSEHVNGNAFPFFHSLPGIDYWMVSTITSTGIRSGETFYHLASTFVFCEFENGIILS